jgi:DNA-binding transcriptional LysR family regulator
MKTPFPDWNDLRDILMITNAGTLSAAAKASGVSQSTMSRRLAAIEAGGQPVFLRDETGRMTPNARGRAMVAAAREMAVIYDNLRASQNDAPPPLRVAACEITARLFLADALPLWSATADSPAELAVHDNLIGLDPQSYDVLVSLMEAVPEQSAGQSIGWLSWALYASPAYLKDNPVPRTVAGLSSHSVILASGSLAEVDAYRWLERQGGAVALLSNSPITMMDACAADMGIALLPTALVENDKRLLRLDTPVCEPSEVWMIADATEATHPRIAGFLRWARNHFRRAPFSQKAGLSQKAG